MDITLSLGAMNHIDKVMKKLELILSTWPDDGYPVIYYQDTGFKMTPLLNELRQISEEAMYRQLTHLSIQVLLTPGGPEVAVHQYTHGVRGSGTYFPLNQPAVLLSCVRTMLERWHRTTNLPPSKNHSAVDTESWLFVTKKVGTQEKRSEARTKTFAEIYGTTGPLAPLPK